MKIIYQNGILILILTLFIFYFYEDLDFLYKIYE